VLRHLTKRRLLVVLLGLAATLAVVLFGKWRDASNRGGQQPAEPFRIAGNLYYVGANDVTSFLLTGPEGHVLIDGGYPGTAPMIMASIAKLGFKITDVKVLLNSHAHFDHAGGLAELQKASGAELWVSEGDADIVAAGGAGEPGLGPFKFLSYIPLLLRYPAPRVDHRFKDGATIRLGPIELTAHVTAGHTPGCTSWSFPVRDGDRELRVVHICSLTLPLALSLGEYPGIRADFERSFRTLRSLPLDIWVTSHAREFGRYRKFSERARVADPVAPFIDRDGYLRYIDSAEMRFRNLLAEQQ
jgi:metallo-beta-lactamase class B